MRTDTNGFATNVTRHVGNVFTGTLAFEVSGSSRKESHVVDHRRNFFRAGHTNGLAAVFGFKSNELFGTSLNRISNAEQRQRAIFWCRVTPGFKCVGCDLHRLVNVGRCRQRSSCILLLCGRINNWDRATVGRVDVLTIDEISVGLHDPTISER